MTTDIKTLGLAFDRAHRLASAHGHWWADVLRPRPQGWTSEQIAAAQTAAINEAEERAMIGLQFSLSHTTATGRLEWEVAADGAVTLLGCRAGRAFGLPAIASVTVAVATVDLGGNARVVYPRGHSALSAGVVGALLWALRDLGLDEEEVLRALGPEAVALWAAEREALAAAALAAAQAKWEEAPSHSALAEWIQRELENARALQAQARAFVVWAEMRRAPPRLPYDRRPVPAV